MIAAWPGPGGREYTVAIDRGREKRVLVLPALFDEGNKLRHFTVELMRRLDAAGIDSFLPDLPGCNESPAALEHQTLAGWREAAEAAARYFEATHGLSIRAGALCEPDTLPMVRYAPTTGPALLRGMLRARVIASREAGIDEDRDMLLEHGRKAGLDLAGYRLGAELIRELEAAEPSGGAALANIAQADVGGPGLWLRAEPDHDPAQADALARLVSGAVRGPSASPGHSVEDPSLTLSVSEGCPELVEGRWLTFACEGETLVGTLDDAPNDTGLLIVTGGNEIRAGAFAGQAQLARRIAEAGFPVFRFDRRGVGDSTGDNRGFRDSGADLAAALAAFRAARPGLSQIVAFGNCDAASALMLNRGAGCDALVLANPWTIEGDDGTPPPAAIRERYAAKLRDPRELLRLATGKVSLRKLAGGLARALRPAAPPSSLAGEMREGLAEFTGPVRILLAGRDRTAQAFEASWDASDPRIDRYPAASHAFVEPDAGEWLFQQVRQALSSTHA